MRCDRHSWNSQGGCPACAQNEALFPRSRCDEFAERACIQCVAYINLLEEALVEARKIIEAPLELDGKCHVPQYCQEWLNKYAKLGIKK